MHAEQSVRAAQLNTADTGGVEEAASSVCALCSNVSDWAVVQRASGRAPISSSGSRKRSMAGAGVCARSDPAGRQLAECAVAESLWTCVRPLDGEGCAGGGDKRRAR